MSDAVIYKKKCICEYDGSGYYGWQFQGRVKSIQEEIEKALYKLYGQEIKAFASGRTDAGVHAYGQVFHYTSDLFRQNSSVVRALNAILPHDISITSVEDVDLDFNSQKSAKGKTYLYRIISRPVRSAFENTRAWYIRDKIEADKLQLLLNEVVGTHDFRSFCMAKSLKRNNVRTIYSIDVSECNDVIEIRITGSGFLHNMVRIIVGTAVELMREGEPACKMKEILDAQDRRNALITAPAHGLYLEQVYY